MNNSDPIYLDYHATTPCDPAVIEVVVPLLGIEFGNASSRQHVYGLRAAGEVNKAREEIAGFIHADPEEIVFTSGSTESINLAIKGVAELYIAKGKHIITAKTEHTAVLDCCKRLEEKGFEITCLQTDDRGAITEQQLQAAIRNDTILIALMWANNETGVIHPIEKFADIANRHNVVFFSDATQALGKIEIDAKNSGAGLLSFSAHKIYGPKGVGALYIRRKNPRVRLLPQIDGGGQEKGLRSGTLNVPGIAGFGKAVNVYKGNLSTERKNISELRDQLESALLKLPEVYINGDKVSRLPTVTNLCFRFTDGKLLMNEINKKLAVSSGSACSSANPEPSHVLLAMGLGLQSAAASIRFSLGRFTTRKDILSAIEIVKSAVEKVRTEQYPSFKSLCEQAVNEVEWHHPSVPAKLSLK
ncbi:cysteine desulfurase family protein [Pollutibacter soli]|uniref:cysteine desulfurase family protein n=1 Tax=Pollutibacter soli TaxID=3034157 RepID=UPI0030132B02